MAPDRTTFLEFQARNRRATWKLSAAYVLVVGLAGILAGLGFLANTVLVLFAVTFIPAVVAVLLSLLAPLTPVTAWLAAPLSGLSTTLFGAIDLVTLPFGRRPGLLWAVALLLPVGAWLAVRSVWLAAGVGQALLAMGARPPASGDLEERQLVNVVHEMAVAAGIPPPDVRLLDGAVANAAAVGWDPAACHVVVGRRLLDEFDREETQSLLGHLVAAIGNGDLRGAAQIHSLLYVLELMIVIVLAPFAKAPRRIALRWLAFPLRGAGGGGEARAEEARQLIRLLTEHRGRFGSVDPERPETFGADYLGRIGAVLVRACPPFMALLLFAQAATGFLLLCASLPVALLWRSRRYLADATAVQLTRHPTGLYRALARLAECGGVVPGGEAVVHLFVVGPEVTVAREARRRQQGVTRWVEGFKARGPAARAPGTPAGGMLNLAAEAVVPHRHLAAAQEQRSQAREEAAARGVFWEREGLLMGMHPSIDRRLRRLARMGAVPTPP